MSPSKVDSENAPATSAAPRSRPDVRDKVPRASLDEAGERVFEAFRRWGYLEADLDPLGFLRPQGRPELNL